MANENTTDKRKVLKEEYPRNLLLAVRGAWEQDEPTELTADILAGIQYAISTLNEREQLVITRRCCILMKLISAVPKFGLTHMAA